MAFPSPSGTSMNLSAPKVPRVGSLTPGGSGWRLGALGLGVSMEEAASGKGIEDGSTDEGVVNSGAAGDSSRGIGFGEGGGRVGGRGTAPGRGSVILEPGVSFATRSRRGRPSAGGEGENNNEVAKGVLAGSVDGI